MKEFADMAKENGLLMVCCRRMDLMPGRRYDDRPFRWGSAHSGGTTGCVRVKQIGMGLVQGGQYGKQSGGNVKYIDIRITVSRVS